MSHAYAAREPSRTFSARGAAMALRSALVAVVAVAAIGSAVLVGQHIDRTAAADRAAQYAAVLKSAQEWELQRRAQSSWVDPVLEHAREWERQRRAQSPDGR